MVQKRKTVYDVDYQIKYLNTSTSTRRRTNSKTNNNNNEADSNDTTVIGLKDINEKKPKRGKSVTKQLEEANEEILELKRQINELKKVPPYNKYDAMYRKDLPLYLHRKGSINESFSFRLLTNNSMMPNAESFHAHMNVKDLTDWYCRTKTDAFLYRAEQIMYDRLYQSRSKKKIILNLGGVDIQGLCSHFKHEEKMEPIELFEPYSIHGKDDGMSVLEFSFKNGKLPTLKGNQWWFRYEESSRKKVKLEYTQAVFKLYTITEVVTVELEMSVS